MKARLLLDVVLATAIWSGAVYAAPERLAGCLDPGVIVAGLETLRDADWAGITLTRIQAIWPPPVRGLECTEATCSVMVREGRIINGEIECEDGFVFDTEAKTGTAAKEQLHSVVIHYTVRSRPEIVSIARSFATAIGVPAANVKTIGESGVQSFPWNSGSSKAGVGVLDLRLTRVRAGWYLFFSIGRPSPQGALSGTEFGIVRCGTNGQ